MSVGANGQYIVCDGEGCQAKTLAPIALYGLISVDSQNLSTKGWLFVHENERTYHFCPRCAPHSLKVLAGREYSSEDSDKCAGESVQELDCEQLPPQSAIS